MADYSSGGFGGGSGGRGYGQGGGYDRNRSDRDGDRGGRDSRRGTSAPRRSNRGSSNKNEQNASGATAPMLYPVEVSLKSMLEAGVHFGHQADKWNPKMLPFIFSKKSGIHILNLDVTVKQWQKAREFIVHTMAHGGNLLMVGTKQQARDIVSREAARGGVFWVSNRWLGGTLSNFKTIKHSIDRMKKLETLLADAQVENSAIKLTKKEKLDIARELGKLEASLGGIRSMKSPPQVLFVVDIIKEAIAVSEARRLHIPVVALVDSNCDPTKIDFPVASNDDSAKTINLFVCAVADAAKEGRALYEARRPQDSAGQAASEGGSGEQPTTKKGKANRAPVEAAPAV